MLPAKQSYVMAISDHDALVYPVFNFALDRNYLKTRLPSSEIEVKTLFEHSQRSHIVTRGQMISDSLAPN